VADILREAPPAPHPSPFGGIVEERLDLPDHPRDQKQHGQDRGDGRGGGDDVLRGVSAGERLPQRGCEFFEIHPVPV
jgi:hypothetical protein